MKKLVPLLFLAAVIAGSAIVGALAATWYWQRESEPQGIAEFEDDSLEITVYAVDANTYRQFGFGMRDAQVGETRLAALARLLSEEKGVVSMGALPSEKRALVSKGMRVGIDRGAQSSNAAACFDPRHVILVRRDGTPTRAWLICFACLNFVELAPESQRGDIHLFRPDEGFDTLLNEAAGKR